MKNIQKILLFAFCSLIAISTSAQAGDSHGFNFLRRPASARTLAIGGDNVSSSSTDLNMAAYNPALISTDMHTSFAFNYQPYLANINATNVAYGHNFKKAGIFVASLQYMSYGEMDNTDPSGLVLGKFQSSEFGVTVGHSFVQGPFSFWANLKFAGSNISSYSAYGLLADLGATYKHSKKDLVFGLVIKNAGFVMKDYTNSADTKMPFDVQIGLTYKLEHMPLKVSVTGIRLYKYDIRYEDPNKPLPVDLNGAPITESNNAFDKFLKNSDIIFRHLVFGGEFLMNKNINIRFGYNHMMRRELQVTDVFSMAGFTAGAMLKIAGFEFAYSRTNFHVAGGLNTLSLTTNFVNTFKKKPASSL